MSIIIRKRSRSTWPLASGDTAGWLWTGLATDISRHSAKRFVDLAQVGDRGISTVRARGECTGFVPGCNPRADEVIIVTEYGGSCAAGALPRAGSANRAWRARG